ncbi:MAG: prenyltransferase [Desulfocapsa sp.]|nr:MAG: prenyltransferase [Desulfocapsa sp.]
MNNSGITPYIKIARLDHWFKNVFMLPGVLVAVYIDHIQINGIFFFKVAIALLVLGLVASSYYVLNEILDADRDRFHPVKKNRPVPLGQINISIGYILWLLLGAAGIALATTLGKGVLYSSIILWFMGCLYNIPPVRTKEKPYLDVLSESVNNPLRLLVGWYATGTQLTAPISLLLSYWMIGAFFMAVKRYAEYVHINDPDRAAAYRESFRHYSKERLLISIIYYTSAFALFFGIFLIRYRIELILSVPLIAGFVAWYMHLGFQENSPVQYPEKLYRQKGFVIYTLFTMTLCLALLYIEIPALKTIFAQTMIR